MKNKCMHKLTFLSVLWPIPHPFIYELKPTISKRQITTYFYALVIENIMHVLNAQ